MATVKSGHLTTEFWANIGVGIATVASAMGSIDLSDTKAIGLFVLSIGYTVLRTWLKRAEGATPDDISAAVVEALKKLPKEAGNA